MKGLIYLIEFILFQTFILVCIITMKIYPASLYYKNNLIYKEDLHISTFRKTSTTYQAQQKIKIAIGMGITTKNVKWQNSRNLTLSLIFFNTLLPSFCNTASKKYEYYFFLAYDKADKYLNNITMITNFKSIFFKFVHDSCPHESTYFIDFVQCSHNGSPAMAQNDAMMAAYISQMDYYYRINDDTKMISSGWTEAFIDALVRFDPPNVGVVGPNHYGGNMAILTYDFVHHTHIEIHGFYYPRVFTGWFADSWITDVYKPNRTNKVKHIKIIHTMQRGTRYDINVSSGSKLKGTLQKGRESIDR